MDNYKINSHFKIVDNYFLCISNYDDDCVYIVIEKNINNYFKNKEHLIKFDSSCNVWDKNGKLLTTLTLSKGLWQSKDYDFKDENIYRVEDLIAKEILQTNPVFHEYNTASALHKKLGDELDKKELNKKIKI